MQTKGILIPFTVRIIMAQNLKSIGAFFFKPQNLIDFHLTIKRFFNLRSRLIVVYNLGKRLSADR